MSDPARSTVRTALHERVAACWPEVVTRLGERREAFLETASVQAVKRGLVEAGDTARYLNLCFAFGPAFEEKPQNEWALGLLLDERLAPWVRLHQLVLRAAQELQRRGGSATNLLRADAELIDVLDVQRSAADSDAEPLARVACDLEALELRLIDIDWRREYRRVDGDWQYLPASAIPPALRIDAQGSAPDRLCVLSQAAGDGPAARLQLRQLVVGGCNADRHPGVRWLGGHGLQAWQGHAAKNVSWAVPSLPLPPRSDGLVGSLFEETPPDIGRVEVLNCGTRDQGVPLGSQRLQVWAYPAQQWLFEVRRGAAIDLQWPVPDNPPAPSTQRTRLRLERDGVAVDGKGWVHGFEEALPIAVRAGMDKLFAAWGKTASGPTMHLEGSLLSGTAALTWGWREGPGGLAGPPLMRLLAAIDLASDLTLRLEGEVQLGSTRTSVRLASVGGTTLRFDAAREQIQPPLLETLLPAVLRWRQPLVIDYDPLAIADGSLWCEAGPCSGALTGEAGLRPCLSGGSGWQWYLRLAIEPVLAAVTVQDPVLGKTARTLALLPALQLVDWSLG